MEVGFWLLLSDIWSYLEHSYNLTFLPSSKWCSVNSVYHLVRACFLSQLLFEACSGGPVCFTAPRDSHLSLHRKTRLAI